MDEECRIVDRGEAGASRVMAILIPPAIFSEVETVFDSPMISDVFDNVVGENGFWIKAGDEITPVAQHGVTVIGGQLAIDAHHDLTIGYRQRFSNVICVS